jgi:hypothetical protein
MTNQTLQIPAESPLFPIFTGFSTFGGIFPFFAHFSLFLADFLLSEHAFKIRILDLPHDANTTPEQAAP